MKIPNKQEFQWIIFNHWSDIDFKDFINLYKERSAKPYYFLMIDTTLASDIHLHFMENILERIRNLFMTTEDKIKDEALKDTINREAAKTLARTSRKNW